MGGRKTISRTCVPPSGYACAAVRSACLLAALAGALCLHALPAFADDACAFKWNVSRELQLFAGAARSVTAAKDPGSLPRLDPGVLYELALTPQDQVHFAAAPAKKALTDGAYAGMVTLHVTDAGRYRVALDGGFWIDLVASGQVLRSADFDGQHGCNGPHKIVVFDLPAGEVVLQLSRAPHDRVRLTLTRAPDGDGH